MNIYKIGNIQLATLSAYQIIWLNTYSFTNECHFLISIIKEVRKNNMITMYLRTFKMKTLLFITTTPPSLYRIEADTQQLIFPTGVVYNTICIASTKMVKFTYFLIYM